MVQVKVSLCLIEHDPKKTCARTKVQLHTHCAQQILAQSVSNTATRQFYWPHISWRYERSRPAALSTTAWVLTIT